MFLSFLLVLCTTAAEDQIIEIIHNHTTLDSTATCSRHMSLHQCETEEQNCAWLEDSCMALGDSLHVYYYVSATLSAIGSLFVVSTYIIRSDFRKHPASLIFGRCIFDITFASIFTMLYFGSKIHKKCNIYTPLLIFCLLGSNTYFIATSWNLLMVMKNPFRSETAYVTRSHVIVWVFSLTVLYSISRSDISEYRFDIQICWIQSYTSQINPYSWMLVYCPIIFAILYAYYVLFEIWRRMYYGLNDTVNFRRNFIYESTVYTVTYSFYWSFAGVSYVCILQSNNTEDSSYILFAIVIALVGIIDAIVWLFKICKKERLSRQTCNSALRKEVLENTMFGIWTCAKKAADDLKFPGKPPKVMYVKNMDENPEPTTAINRVLTKPPGQQKDWEDGDWQKKKKFGAWNFCQYRRETFVKDYAPQVFRYIREDICGLSDESYRGSFYADEESESMAKVKYSEGRSGSFFYFTHDSRFMVKTISRKEAKLLLNILEQYVEFLKENPGSLISRILGLHSLHIYDLKIYLVVMENIFIDEMYPQEIYDIKGSWVDRHTAYKVAPSWTTKDTKHQKMRRERKTMKDNDLHIRSERGVIILSENGSEKLLNQLEKDTTFLSKLKIMDYSLLIGIYYIKLEKKERSLKEEKLMQMETTESVSSAVLKSPRYLRSMKCESNEANFQTQIAKKFAGLTPADGYQALTDQIALIKNTLNHFRKIGGDDIYDSEDYFTEDVKQQIRELERLGNLYSNFTEDDNVNTVELSPTRNDSRVTRTVDIFQSVESQSVAEMKSKSPKSSQPVKPTRTKRVNPWSYYKGGVKAQVTEGPGIYYLGVIDMLQEWNLKKKAERFLKVTFLRKDKEGLSAIEPVRYQERFMERMRMIIRNSKEFLTESKVKVEEFQQTSFEMHMWPTPDEVQQNLEEAAQKRVPNIVGAATTQQYPSVQVINPSNRPRWCSSPQLSNKKSDEPDGKQVAPRKSLAGKGVHRYPLSVVEIEFEEKKPTSSLIDNSKFVTSIL